MTSEKKSEILNKRKNINRGYRQLIVWNDSVELYALVTEIFNGKTQPPFKTSNNITDAAHSISRNIAEGYTRKSQIEYLRFLDIALGSTGEVYSGCFACLAAEQISEGEFERIDVLHYKVENSLIKLIESIQKKLPNSWRDSFAEQNLKNLNNKEKNN
ncbi:MAG: four helix bundle protein [Bacteroidia bacterium]|nr:four helix bundle protein [Bacteroidia bacterium]